LGAGFFRSSRDLLLENLALRQQLAILKAAASAAAVWFFREIVLGDPAAALVWMEAVVDSRPA